MKKKIIISSISVTIACLVGVLGYLYVANEDEIFETDEKVESENFETEENEEEVYEEFETNSVVKIETSTQAISDGKVELMSFTIDMPKATENSNEEFSETINAYYKKESNKLAFFIDEYEDEVQAKSEEQGEMFTKYLLTAESYVTYEDEELVSIVRYVETFTGGAQIHPTMYSEVFRVSDGALMLMNDVFNIEKNKSAILEYIIKNYVDDTYYSNANELVYDLFDANNYFITEEGVYIYYQKYDIAPGMTDLPVFFVPYSEIELENGYKYLGEINE